MKTVYEGAISVPANSTFSYRSGGFGGPDFEVRGPGEVYIRARQFGERRSGKLTRRARGAGEGPHFRRISPHRGRRIGDYELHQDRRRTIIGNPEACTKDNPLGQWRGRRKNDERRQLRLKGTLAECAASLLAAQRRRRGDERREPGRSYTYRSSYDPRVRALERRGKSIDFGWQAISDSVKRP